ncbi:MAG: ATP-binding protein [Planctomycetota bacterium]|nr:MAG: ATP-binding protein [Planctomycetota bacterium]REK26767.1 MAG: ATP-binding protein [Planctomycetota bacterium]REK35732.1 MAG: ATP-binding protein [Planctomycetota bacterium]
MVLYDSKDLTTHAVIVGMTGSGKTGLGVTLLEEAAIDGIPAIIVDPKGDMGNLLLNFPELDPRRMEQWIEPDAAARNGMTVAEYAAEMAKTWQDGLAQWGQTPERIARLRDAADTAIYTPGSNAGLPVSVLKSLDAPAKEILEDGDAMRERVSSSVSGLLALLGIDADPLRSREHILLSNVVDDAWRNGRSLDMPGLIRAIQSPPFEQIGIMDVETIFPADDRMQLAMTLNNVLASPGFSGWTQGEPLNIQRLLYSQDGKPRLSILSIAHLSDRERMFFVTILLNEVLAWMRSQSGTSSLRALLYMDEVFGYLPPTANPPSKTPLLTLLKQARAFGLGLVLATQNPVDLDYKALSNAGTWFLGRLQTERDKLRVLDGLEGASATAGAEFDRKQVERILSGVKSRVFLMNNVHEDAPVVFHTRWALSFLRGPLTREQIQTLMQPRRNEAEADPAPAPAAPQVPATDVATTPVAESTGPPIIAPEIHRRYVGVSRSTPRSARIVYRPGLFATARLHFDDAKSRSDVDLWQETARLCIPGKEVAAQPWDDSQAVEPDRLALQGDPEPEAAFGDLPTDMAQARPYSGWQKSLKDHLYREERLPLFFCPSRKEYSKPDETEGAFKGRLQHALHEERDLQIEKVRQRYASKIDRLQDRHRKALERVDKEKSQANSATMSAALSFGTTVLSALFGRKLASSTNVSKAATSMRSAGRAVDQRGDIARAQAGVEAIAEDIEELEAELEKELDRIREETSVDSLEIEPYEITPKKSDITVSEVTLAWLPYRVDENDALVPAWDCA